MRAILGFGLVVVVGGVLGGCGDDDTGDGTTTGQTTASNSGGSGSGGDGGTGATGGAGQGGGGAGQGGAGGGTGGAPTGGAGPGGAGGGNANGDAFCMQYGQDCGFGSNGHFNDNADCIDDFENKFDSVQQTCVQEHLNLAAGDMNSIHCEHATGEGPCS